ncbi:MAG: hypothetical protein KF729_38220 [Sandaracinaceae bacterium]|nr:hypothetical protein [Sandaracinaceae bacterium]
MAFRSDAEALRARIDVLEGELARARERIAELERDAAEAPALRAKIEGLERALGRHRDSQRPKVARAAAIGVGVIAVGGVAAFLALSEADGPRHDDPPQRGVIDLEAASSQAPLSGVAIGDGPVGNSCPGYASAQPFVTLRTASGTRRARLFTQSSADLVLYVRTADGRVVCDDDSGEGLNPQLFVDLGPGDHAVWVGTYSSGARADFVLHVDGRGPGESRLATDAEAELPPIRIGGVDRHVRDGSARGDVLAALGQTSCRGYVPSAPSVDLLVDAPGFARIVARGPTDLVLLVRRPDGTFACDDDGAGDYDPLVAEALVPGRYRVWVGTYAANARGDFQLSVEVDAAPRVDPSAPPRLGRWDLDTETLLSFSERVSGATPISATHPECRELFGGSVPDLELDLSEARTVTLTLTSAAPLGVLVEHPDGTHTCERSRATRAHAWAAGAHRVWVGSPAQGGDDAFTLVVSSLPP